MQPLPITVHQEARQRARELRQQAIDEAFAAAARWLRRLFAGRRPAPMEVEVQSCHS